MKKHKILALAIAGALACPQVAFAARDGDGMEYTSAAEGFYGSLRTHFSSSGGKDTNSSIDPGGSRLGVRGTLDIGHGLTGVYRYEWSVSSDNGEAPGNTRLHYVGLKGAFGEAQIGSLWENDYNWVTAATDIATTGSGNFAPHFRRANSLQYTSPNLNGFQGSFRVMMNGGKDNGTPEMQAGCYDPDDMFVDGGAATANLYTNGVRNSTARCDGRGETYKAKRDEVKASENVDEWAVSAKYGVRGFTVAGAYEIQPDGASDITTDRGSNLGVSTDDATKAKEDKTFWAVRGGYGQDNWAVNAWYGVHNTGDTTSARLRPATGTATSQQKPDDTTIVSFSGNIDVGKVGLVAIHENKENEWGQTDTATIMNVNYHFTSKSRVYGAYIARDYDTDANKDDEVRIGLRMDF